VLLIIVGSAFAANKDNVEVKVFFSPTCHDCLIVKQEIIPSLQDKYQQKINIEYLNIADKENYESFLNLGKKFNKKDLYVPASLVEGKLLVGKKEIRDNLEKIISQSSGNNQGRLLQSDSDLSSKIDIKEHFASFGLGTVLSAGFIDGFNPCAFGVIVFFISFLSLSGYRRRSCIYIGSFFILAVFCAYLLIGLGIFQFLYLLRQFYFFMKVFYFLLAMACFVFAFFALWDYLKLKGVNVDKINLKMPAGINKFSNKFSGCSLKAHSLIKKYFQPQEGKKGLWSKIKLALISFFVGFAVSILEAACTGQVYLPTISLCLMIPELRTKAFLYLVLYNLMFIIPLVVVFLLALKGVASEKFGYFAQAHAKFIRLVLFILLLSLGFIFILFY
jgi:hypothetical protein